MAATPATPPVTLRVPQSSLRAGEQVVAVLSNASAAKLEVAECPTLARLSDGRFIAITHTHGQEVACPTQNPANGSVRPGGTVAVDVELYDDLTPGSYRVTLPYRRASSSRSQPPFSSTSTPVASVTFTVTAFDPGPPPHLSERRIATIARRTAKQIGDAQPTLIQYAEGTRFLATLLGDDGDLVFAWNWSYLVAIRGNFPAPHISSPPGIPTGPGPVVHPFTVETLVINARTGEVTDASGSDTYPRLSRLGSVTTVPNP